MMKKVVDIFDISYEGSGVAKLDGQVVFVPKTLPQERVEVEIEKQKASFATAKVVKLLKKSEKRCDAVCPYFDVCGGCAFQHCTQQYEQELKTNILKRELKKVGYAGKVNFVGSSKRFSYRNKIKFEVKDGKLGYFKNKSHDFFEVKFCPIADIEINHVLPAIEKFLDYAKPDGLKNVYVKVFEGKIGICFLFPKNAQKVPKNINFSAFFEGFSVFYAFGQVLESNHTQLVKVFGKGNFPMDSFNQVNDEIAKKLYEHVVSATTGARVVNAYAGQGLLTSQIAQKADFVYGIEIQKSAHQQALKNAPSNVCNICGAVENELEKVLQADKDVDTIVLDPSREGCRVAVLSSILQAGLRKVVYVSCNFATLVRDLGVLCENYAIENVTIFDMFACTNDMETVVCLEKH